MGESNLGPWVYLFSHTFGFVASETTYVNVPSCWCIKATL